MRTITGCLTPSIRTFSATHYCPSAGKAQPRPAGGRVQPKQVLFDSLLIDWIEGQ